jgi:hypothetical protein
LPLLGNVRFAPIAAVPKGVFPQGPSHLDAPTCCSRTKR